MARNFQKLIKQNFQMENSILEKYLKKEKNMALEFTYINQEVNMLECGRKTNMKAWVYFCIKIKTFIMESLETI